MCEQHSAMNAISCDDNNRWFAMRVTYNREMSVKQMLDAACIVSYIPLRHVVKYKNGKRVTIAKPVIRGLLFVNCTKAVIMQFKLKLPYLQYMTHRMEGKNIPIIVPDDQMDSFIKATSADDKMLEYLNLDGQDFTRGTKVKIHGGELDGVVGRYMRVAGKRNKRLIVQVENVMAVAIDVSQVNYIEALN